MNWLVAAALFWVIASAAVAMLPMRHQYAPGLALLLLAPVLIVLIGREWGLFMGTAALLAFFSMYRHPLRYLARRALGRPTERPPR
ncbi:MAG: DUF2484 family protein [Pseudomonadota bacterium]